MAGDPTKATHYLQQLDSARCEGSWDHVPELVRKVRKHAPDRACLALTAETEHSISVATQTSLSDTRPATAVAAKDLAAADTIIKLLDAAEHEKAHLEDRYQCRVCVGWLHWVVGEYSLAAARLPKSLEHEFVQADSVAIDSLGEWTKVCSLKSVYLRANCMVRAGQLEDALSVFNSALPSLAPLLNSPPSTKQLRYWTELFLTEYCMVTSQAIKDNPKSLMEVDSLSCFRSWARYWESSRTGSVTAGYGFRGSVPRRRIWLEYYGALSLVLQQDSPFPTGNLQPVTNESSARSRLRVELKKVEASYEALLLNETQFPRAEEEREEVEDFVALVMQNWEILNGRAWREADLGQGGRESLSRGVLDILYRAATKTFHSVSILRSLFTVHVAVAEFDLAIKAFDSYLDLMKRGKARVKKTGHVEPSLDDDATALHTMSSCVAALCRYGDRQAAEKAKDLAAELEKWLQQLAQSNGVNGDGNTSIREDAQTPAPSAKVPPEILALGWQSVGLANAQWARVTFDSASRTEIQSKAVLCLRKSLSLGSGRSADVSGVFALSLLLAEQRELTTAIELVKSALLASDSSATDRKPHAVPYWRERCLISLWHLLALLLSARQDYVVAARACEGAFEQFDDPSVLFGAKQLNNVYRSDHLNEAEAKNGEEVSEAGRGVVDQMDDFEKESILEVKMTQLALVELLEGPKVAVNASLELLTLFSRLFGSVQNKPSLSNGSTRSIPKSSAGTIRSITGSFFGRGSERSGRARQSTVLSEKALPAIPSRPHTTQTMASTVTTAPTIQVSHENGSIPELRRARKSASLTRREPAQRNSLRKRDRSSSRRRATSSGGLPQQDTLIGSDNSWTPAADDQPDSFAFSSKRFPSSAADSPLPASPLSMSVRRTLSHSDSYLSSRSRLGTAPGGMAADVSGISVDTVDAPSDLLPLVQFSKEHDRRRRSAVLVRLWLMVAGFYRRAELFEEAKGALAEAQKLVQSVESDIGKDTSGSLSLKHAGWAGKRSVEELYGDVWAEMGYLSLAKDAPYDARAEFEAALTHFPDHPAAIVGLSNILLDIYTEKLLPPPAVPRLKPVGGPAPALLSSPSGGIAGIDYGEDQDQPTTGGTPASSFPAGPLGLSTPLSPKALSQLQQQPPPTQNGMSSRVLVNGRSNVILRQQQQTAQEQLTPPYKAQSLPLIDRLAARDRAYALLTGLTRLGDGWNRADAWLALARAHEESGRLNKAQEALWWCVELEEAAGVRDWECAGVGGYVL